MKYTLFVLASIVSAFNLCMHPIKSRGKIIGYVSKTSLAVCPLRNRWHIYDAHKNYIGAMSSYTTSDKPSWLKKSALVRYIKRKTKSEQMPGYRNEK